jgi:hypothetical protein
MWQPGMSLEDVEKAVIQQAFAHFKKNKTQTALSLGIAIRTLDTKLASYETPAPNKDTRSQLLKRVKAAMIHFRQDINRVSQVMYLSVEQVKECVREITSQETSRGLGVEPALKVSEEQPLPVRKPTEVQEVLPGKVSTGSPKGNGKSSATAS